jgi:GH24 family phage-related lysozyme (muramidase)
MFGSGDTTTASASAPASSTAPAGAPPAPASSTVPTSAPAGGGSAPKPATQRDSGDASRTANNAPPPDGKKGAGGALDDAATKAMIARHEGTRLSPYKDSLGLWTVGVGHLIGDGKSLPDSWNRQFSREEVMAMFDKDYESHKAEAKSNTPNFDSMSGQMKSAFVDLAFNMGGNWLNTGNKGKGWPILKKQLNSKDAEGVADNLGNSKWADDVKGGRAGTILGLIKSGFAANGGIFDGPKSGYPMTLHGQEAVIPLKDSAVPVTMSQEFNTTAANLGELVNIMKNNVGMQATMLAVLEDMRRSQSNTADNTSRIAAVAAN